MCARYMFVDSRLRPECRAPSSHSWSTWLQRKPRTTSRAGAGPKAKPRASGCCSHGSLSSSRARAGAGSSRSSRSNSGARRSPRTGVSFAARAGQAAALVQVQELEQPPVQTPAPDPHKVQAMALIASGAGATTESGSRPGGLQPVLPSASAPELSHPRRAPGPALELPRARRQL